MRPIQLLFISSLLLLFACDPEPTGPEMNCELLSSYDLGYFAVKAGKVFDIGETPPKELRNGFIEYDLVHQFFGLTFNNPDPPPYDRYFIKHVLFLDNNLAEIKYFENDSFQYQFLRNDCQIDFFIANDTIHAELIDGGEEVSIEKYAFFDYYTKPNGLDTAVFIEFRRKDFKSTDEIIVDFVKDHSGEFDTVGVELVVSRTQE